MLIAVHRYLNRYLPNMDLQNEAAHANNINFSFIVKLDNAKKEANSILKPGSNYLTAVAALLMPLCSGLASASN